MPDLSIESLSKPATPIVKLEGELLREKDVNLYLKRDDLIDDLVSGNKWRKLKYNLFQAAEDGAETLISFGGAFSNHLYALAAAGKRFGFRTVGLVRGEDDENNPTIKFLRENDMHLQFLDRNSYRKKNEVFIELVRNYEPCYILPEGGTNELALKGTGEIVEEIDIDYNYLCVPCGTGGTLGGILNNVSEDKQILGYCALKGIESFYRDLPGGGLIEEADNLQFITDYHFGGFAKLPSDLIGFMKWFNAEFEIQLDPIYTSKMMYGIFDQVKANFFPHGSTVVAIHTGGLQGLDGFRYRGILE